MTAPEELTRRQRIITATLDTITKEGLEGTTMRRIAQAAGVSVGAITHYFDGRESLLLEAMTEYTEAALAEYETYFTRVTDLESAREGIKQTLTAPARSRLGTIVGSELYTISLRRPRFRLLLDKWTRSPRDIMLRYFDPDTVFMIDALYEGLLLHRRMHLGEYPDELVDAAVERLTPPGSYVGPGAG